MKRFNIGGPEWTTVAELVNKDKGIALVFADDFLRWADENAIVGDVTLALEKIHPNDTGLHVILTFHNDSDAMLFRLFYNFEVVPNYDQVCD